MLDEARKREKVANAFLAATMAATAAQSPKDLVRMGHVESPGTALMQMFGKKRGEAERNLDSGRVSHPSRNRKKKTFNESKNDEMLSLLILLIMKEIKRRRKMAFLSHEEVKLKTYNQFMTEANIDEMSQASFSSRKELENYHGGIPSGYYANNAGSKEDPKWRLKPKEGGIKERKVRAERIATLSSDEDKKAAASKAKKLRKAGLDAHHITPLHYSAKIRDSMSDAEWEERVKRDAANGIYHGHHPKNIMGAVSDRTPESRSKRGIRHRTGGAHELEGKTRELYSGSISHKDLLAASQRIRLRKEKENK